MSQISKDKNVSYIYSDLLADATSQIPNFKNRGKLVHGLIEAYGLISELELVEPFEACDEDILSFHSKQYFDILCSTANNKIEFVNEKDNDVDVCNTSNNSTMSLELDDDFEGQEDYGLGYDCPLFPNLNKIVKIICGGTLTGCKLLLDGKRIVINWLGGYHHAMRNEASGFCYVNDIVIGIQTLQKKFKKILYIDLDSHHGDGVENAFCYTKKVFTLSFHNHEPGYFPGTGNVSEVGLGQGKYHCVNVPLKSGINDDQYFSIFSKIFKLVKSNYDFECIVIQCGADSITKDPLGSFNLTPNGLGKCIQQLISTNRPILFLGGGGYNLPNTSKYWTYLTSMILEKSISNDIPEHKYFPLYGPSFELEIFPSLSKNNNTPKYLDSIYSQIFDNFEKFEKEL